MRAMAFAVSCLLVLGFYGMYSHNCTESTNGFRAWKSVCASIYMR